MNILIVYNPQKDIGLKIAEDVSNFLVKLGVNTKIVKFNKTREIEIEDIYKIAVVIGGDGTILKVAKSAAMVDCAVLGINAGRLGYLASANIDNFDILKRLVTGDYTVQPRMMLKADKIIDGKVIESFDCLNDAVISKDSLSNVIDIVLKISNDTISYRADGIIAATPTGSTAYSLSAGGPVVDPSLNCIILTPVCPHTLVTRSMVVDGNTPISISLNYNYKTHIHLSCDGRKAFELDNHSSVNISVSDISAKFIKLNDVSVYKILSQKTDNY